MHDIIKFELTLEIESSHVHVSMHVYVYKYTILSSPVCTRARAYTWAI